MKYYVLATFFALSAPVDAMPDMKNRLNNFKGKMKSKISPDMKMPDVKKGFNNMKGKLESKISPAKKKNSVTYPDDLLFKSDWKDDYSRPFQVAMVEYKLAWEALDAAMNQMNKKLDEPSEKSFIKATETKENAKKKYFEAKSKITSMG